MVSRLNKWLENSNFLKESQAGFRTKRRTRDHIFVRNELMNNKLMQPGGKLFISFVNYKNTFDKVPREKLLKKVEAAGIKGRMLCMLQAIYSETINQIGNGSFRSTAGVRQGCVLSSTLFNIYIDDVDNIRATKIIGGIVFEGKKFYVEKYADDIVPLADTAEGLKNMLKGLEAYADENGLLVNAKKTKIMIVEATRRNLEIKTGTLTVKN